MILPASLEPRAFLGADSISYSELNTLAQCEAKHSFSYGDRTRERTAPSAAMALGSEIHAMYGDWWRTGQVPVTEDETAAWVMDRYAQHYGADRDNGMHMLANEQPFAVRLPGRGRRPFVFGFIDGVFEVRGMGHRDGIWLGELKTTRDLGNILSLEASAQPAIYLWAAHKFGGPLARVRGVLLDVARTYKPKKELALSESFTRRWLTYTPAQLDAAVAQVERAVEVRRALRDGAAPLKAVGPMCRGCPHVAPCFGLTVDIEDEDAA